MGFMILDAKGSDYYNDPIVYATRSEATVELQRAQAWAREESQYEDSWQDAQLCIVEVPNA